MEETYVNAVVENSSDFCEIFNNYEDELKNLGEMCEAISKEVDDYNNIVATNGNPSEQSYDALDDSRKYHDANGNVVPYSNLTVTQKRGLVKELEFIADREIELHDEMEEASYNMQQSARRFVKDLQDKVEDIKRSSNHLGQLNLQYVADMARNQNVIDDCLHEMTKATTVDEKRDITNRRIQALKDNRKTELTFRINVALINATNLIQSAFSQVIVTMNTTIKNGFENIDTRLTGYVEDTMDIMSDLSKLMSSFTSIKNDYQAEKELITSINEKCKEMKNAFDDKNVKKFANSIMKTTKEFSNLIENVQKYNEEQKLNSEEPKPEGPTPEGPTPEGQKPEGPTPEGQKPEGPTPEGPTPEEQKPEEQKPEGQKPEDPKPVNPFANGDFDDILDGPVRQNQLIEWKVNRRRQSDAAKRHLGMAALGIGLVAANGLGLGVIAGPYLSAGILAVAGIGAAKGGMTMWKRHSATHKLKKIASKMRKEGLNIRLGEFDYENGSVEYMLRTEDGQDIPLKDADQDPRLIDALQDRLNKEFRNDKRGLGKNASRTSKFEIDMHEMPKVTVNNLEAAYAPIGGIRSFKDDVLGEAFSWDTNSSLIARIKDNKFIRNLRNKEEKPVAGVELDDIVEEPVVTGDEELVEEEVTPEVTEEETQEQGAPEVDIPEVQEQEIPEVDTPEVQEQDAPEVQTPEVQEQEIPEVQTPETQEPNLGNQQDTEEDLFSSLDDPSSYMDTKLTDEEIAALLDNLENADDMEQGIDDIARAAEEEAPGRRL